MQKSLLYFISCLLLLAYIPSVSAQIYDIDAFDGQTITTCLGRFTDSRPGTSDYFNDEDYTVTFCSGSTDVLRFIINPNENAEGYSIVAGDTLYAYDATSGALLATFSAGEDPGSNVLLFNASSPCITFRWISDAAGDSDGWEMDIECVPSGCGSGNNPPPADEFADAPYICNFDGYCATTNGYTADEPFNFVGGGSCPTIFGGTIENNSWLAFEAAGPNISFQIDVIGCYGAFGYDPDPSPINYGIQAAIMHFDGTSTFTRISDCTLSDGQQLSFTLNNTSPLNTGDTYYLVVDGSSGSICDYQINVIGDAAVIDAGNDQAICNGSSATLTATGPAGSTYSWTAVGGGFGPTAGSSVMVSPTNTTQYVVEVTSPGGCNNQTDTVEIVVNSCGCAIDLIVAASQTACVPATNTYTQEVTITYTNAPVSGTLDVNGQSFAIGTSPQTVTLTNLVADGNPVSVTASFSANGSCTLTTPNLFTAPVACGTACTPDNGSWD